MKEGAGSVLCKDMRIGGNRDKLAQDIFSHFNIVLCNHQCFLDVLVRVSLTHEVLDLTTYLRVGFSSCCSAAGKGRDGWDRAGPTLRVDSSGQRLWGSLWCFPRL